MPWFKKDWGTRAFKSPPLIYSSLLFPLPQHRVFLPLVPQTKPNGSHSFFFVLSRFSLSCANPKDVKKYLYPSQTCGQINPADKQAMSEEEGRLDHFLRLEKIEGLKQDAASEDSSPLELPNQIFQVPQPLVERGFGRDLSRKTSITLFCLFFFNVTLAFLSLTSSHPPHHDLQFPLLQIVPYPIRDPFPLRCCSSFFPASLSTLDFFLPHQSICGESRQETTYVALSLSLSRHTGCRKGGKLLQQFL